MSGNAARLYDEDFVRWTEQQAAALREAAGTATNLPLDWENLAEEIDSLGRSQKRELRSRLDVILEHLIKLENSPAIEPRAGWISTIGHERSDIEYLLNDSPSLKSEMASMIIEQCPKVARRVDRELSARREITNRLEMPAYTEEQVLGDWFPGDAPSPRLWGEGVAPSAGAEPLTRGVF